jgi:hypothetical protein
LVDEYNARVAPLPIGRPLAASEAQQEHVRALYCLPPRASLREIAKETGLGLRTIRTIIGKIEGTERTTVKRKKLRRLQLNRAKMATWRGASGPATRSRRRSRRSWRTARNCASAPG